jgi:hypothetical protein
MVCVKSVLPAVMSFPHALFVLSVFAVSNYAYAQCDGILQQGVFDDFYENSGGNLKSEVSTLLESDFEHFQEAKSHGEAGASFLYGVIYGSASGSTDEQKFDDLKSHYLSDTKNFFQSNYFTQICRKVANPSIVKAWSDCQQDRTFLAYATGNQLREFNVTAKYSPKHASDPKEIIIQDFICPDDVLLESGGSLQKGAKVGAFQAMSAKLRRVHATSQSSIQINTNNGDSVTVELAAGPPPVAVKPDYSITDKQPHTYNFSFICAKDNNGKIWISLANPCGGMLDGRNYNFFLSTSQRAVQIPIPQGCTTYAFGKLSLEPETDSEKYVIYFEGGLHTTDGTQSSVTHSAVAEVDKL